MELTCCARGELSLSLLAVCSIIAHDRTMRDHLPAPLARLIFPDDLFRPEAVAKEVADDGVVANARLTALFGAVLVALFGAEGVTLLNVSGLLDWHVGIGVAAAAVVVFKLFSTGYRMVRYYGRDGRYIASGPPHPVMRVIAPLLVLATVAVIASGLAALYFHTDLWLGLHKLSFFGWIALAAVHVLVYFWRLPRVITAPRGRHERSTARPALTWGLAVLVVVMAVMLGGWYAGVMPQLPPDAFGHGNH